MNPQNSAALAEPPQMPLPGRQFQRFVLLFHIAFVTGMLLILPSRWHRSGFVWNGTEVGVLALVLVQVGFYIRFFAWPAPEHALPARLGFYFPISFALWFITWRIEPAFEWVALGYLGQLLGAVSPKFSIPGTATVFFLYLPVKFGWSGLAQLSIKEWLAYGAMMVVWSALGLFIHRLATTSAERARLIQELKTARQELELARDRDAELAVLRERERLARELHDSLGHGLVTLTVQLEAAQRLYPLSPDRASALMDGMKALTRNCMEQLRRSIAGLRAPGLGERPLADAIHELCAETSKRTGLRIECSVKGDALRLKPAVAEAVWRLAQEGLANVEKHANAKSSQILVEIGGNGKPTPDTSAEEVRLRVTDDGAGVPPGSEEKPGHYGLRGLRERVEGLGGSLNLSSRPGQGTTLEARLRYHL